MGGTMVRKKRNKSWFPGACQLIGLGGGAKQADLRQSHKCKNRN